MTDQRLITVEWCRSRHACYGDDELREILGDGLTAAEVLDLDIPAEHRVWMVSKWLPDRERRAFLADLLGRMLDRERCAGRKPSLRSVAVLDALNADRWPTDEERSAAWKAWASAAKAEALKAAKAKSAAKAKALKALKAAKASEASEASKAAKAAWEAADEEETVAWSVWEAWLWVAEKALRASKAADEAAKAWEAVEKAKSADEAAKAWEAELAAAWAAETAVEWAVETAAAWEAAERDEFECQLVCLRRLVEKVSGGGSYLDRTNKQTEERCQLPG